MLDQTQAGLDNVSTAYLQLVTMSDTFGADFRSQVFHSDREQSGFKSVGMCKFNPNLIKTFGHNALVTIFIHDGEQNSIVIFDPYISLTLYS